MSRDVGICLGPNPGIKLVLGYIHGLPHIASTRVYLDTTARTEENLGECSHPTSPSAEERIGCDVACGCGCRTLASRDDHAFGASKDFRDPEDLLHVSVIKETGTCGLTSASSSGISHMQLQATQYSGTAVSRHAV